LYFNQVFEPRLAQNSYLIGCQETGEAIVIDPMRDIERYLEIALKESLKIVAVAETHIHADYLSGLREFAERFGTLVMVSDEGTKEWKYDWVINSHYNYRLLKSNDTFQTGNIKFEVIHTPGHSPEHISFIVSDLIGGKGNSMGILSGDFVFAGDVGRPDLLETATGQMDTMKPSAKDLYHSLQTFRTLPNYLQLWPGHRAGSACGKSMSSVPVSTIGYELQSNLAIKETANEQKFVDYILYGQPEPPMYFARMKRENKFGPKLLGQIPEPDKFSACDLAQIIDENNTAIVDTRTWEEYKVGHIHGSIFAPLNNSFSTVTGSYITPDISMYLIIDEHQLKEAVSGLIRIGLDSLQGYITPDELLVYQKNGGELIGSEEVSTSQLKTKLNDDDVFLLDVRESSEFDEIGYIKGAYNIAHTRLHYRLNEIPRNKIVMVQCRTGSRSKYAFSYLEKKGFKVDHVTGGILDWINAGNKVEQTNKVSSPS
jgi:hydroxyacylglutathione hydrolase